MVKVSFYKDVKVLVREGVYEPAEDTYMILNSISERGPGMALDVGTGSGIIAIWLAKLGFNVIATDISMKALKCAKENAKMNDVKIDFVLCDLAEPIRGCFDIVTFNPPYLPFKDNIPEEVWWYGGKDLIAKFLNRDLPRLLKPGGKLYFVYSSLSGIESLEEILPQNFQYTIVDEKKFMFESLYAVKVMRL